MKQEEANKIIETLRKKNKINTKTEIDTLQNIDKKLDNNLNKRKEKNNNAISKIEKRDIIYLINEEKNLENISFSF